MPLAPIAVATFDTSTEKCTHDPTLPLFHGWQVASQLLGMKKWGGKLLVLDANILARASSSRKKGRTSD